MPDYEDKQPCQRCAAARRLVIDWAIAIVCGLALAWYVTKGMFDAGY